MSSFCPQNDPVNLVPQQANPLLINLRNSNSRKSQVCPSWSDPQSTAFPFGFSPINFTYQCFSGGGCVISTRPSKIVYFI